MKSDCILQVEDLRKSFFRSEDTLDVLDGLSFDVQKGDIISIVGPSGCGKTTLIEILAQLQSPSSGVVRLAPPAQSNGLHSRLSLIVFQQYNRTMYPFMTVAGNVRFVLDAIPGLSRSEKGDRVREALAVTSLAAFADYHPWELSGGMQQRVAFARAIAARPMLLLLDEAFGSLDTQTRYRLEDELLSLRLLYDLTIVYITHDIDSAIYCGTRLMLLSSRPARIISLVDNDLPFPRDQLATRQDRMFLAHRERLYTQLRDEMSKGDSVA